MYNLYILKLINYFIYRINIFFAEKNENFDRLYHTETTQHLAVKYFDPISSDFYGAMSYEPTLSSIFKKILRQINISYKEYTFIDIGSGKGRVVMLAADYPFKKVIGIEVCKNLHAIALSNIQKYKAHSLSHANIQLILQNALDFEFPQDNIIIYLFNPFDEKIIYVMVGKIKKLLEQHAIKIIIIYCNPVFDNYIERLPVKCHINMKNNAPYGWKVYGN